MYCMIIISTKEILAFCRIWYSWCDRNTSGKNIIQELNYFHVWFENIWYKNVLFLIRTKLDRTILSEEIKNFKAKYREITEFDNKDSRSAR